MFLLYITSNVAGDEIQANVYNMTFYIDLIESKVLGVEKNLKTNESVLL